MGGVNSEGDQAQLTASCASVGRNVFRFRVRDAAEHASGLFFYGSSAAQVPFGDGFRCVGGPVVVRLPGVAQTNGNGVATRQVDLTQGPFASGPGAATAGSTWFFQF